jgi:tetratricopeptide (TPR) repeat protein
MFTRLRHSLLSGAFVLLAACTAWAQTSTLEGNVKDQKGDPLKGAKIVLTRTDIKGHYEVKTDKKGHWLYTGLPFGAKFDITCEVDGKVMDKVSGVQARSDNPPVDFNLQKTAQAQQAAAQANASGQMTQEQERGMSKEDKAKMEAQMKARAEEMKKNKALNDAFNAAQDSIKQAAAQPDKAQKVPLYQSAVDKLTEASKMELSPQNKVAVLDSLGEAYYGMAQAQTGDDRTKSLDGAIDAYKQSLAIKPDDAAVYNQLGNAYGAEKKIPEATEALNKAVQLNPGNAQGAAKAYFNMGANLVNSGQAANATEFFKKATDTDPTYAEAWYQLGSTSMMKGTVDPKTGQQTYPPDTATALKKYLELQPNGAHAQEASAMLQALGETVQTKTVVPGASSTTKKKRQ